VKGWTGLLVEPNPEALSELLLKKRRSVIFPRCLSTKKRPETIDFDIAGPLGGIVHDGREPGVTVYR
jgi:hypothetical protein